ncbi:MAG: hypothetical protein KatS3mg105_2517 [Gemmatales bacterium]|nr:MAG: hypothetical protein KatS3mg105_2517 [Gemmatales bacterium]
MAVAVKNTPETTAKKLSTSLALGCVAGVVAVIASLSILFYWLPQLWTQALGTAPISLAICGLLQIVALGTLFVYAGRWIGSSQRAGLKAGIFCTLVTLVVAAWLTSVIGGWLENVVPGNAGLLMTIALGVVFLALIGRMVSSQGFEKKMIALEEQGWFTIKRFKASQGLRVRRGTMLGILILTGSGIWTLITRELLVGAGDWRLAIPYTDRYIVLLPDLQFTLPLLLAAGSLWLAFRVVNLPVFADFLIATEAELNKVSWPTRRRLMQDTVVVLVTVLILTVFLFVVNVAWRAVLTKLTVLRPPEQTTTQTQELEW